ncbi:MAG: hypothetical protein HY260_07505 [Chloroflexi bacterium]|nr:hypothetical protein [Chloroflexota bacterium]
MKHDSSLADTQPFRQKRSWQWLLYLLAGLALVAALAWATLDVVRQAPSRDTTADLGPYGLITIRFSTDPNPPLPTGTVTLRFMPMDSRQRPVALDGLSFEYGREGSDRPASSGEAQLMSDGSGMYMGGAQFPEVGNWWVRVRLAKGGQQAEARFRLYVEPAQ